MCLVRKQCLNAVVAIVAIAVTGSGAASAADAEREGPRGAGGVAVGEGSGGVTDRAFVAAPPNYAYVIEREPGSFLDCGEGQDARAVDHDGRDTAILRCGVTLTETIIIPAAAVSARLVVHF